jgi:hypothetical protein
MGNPEQVFTNPLEYHEVSTIIHPHAISFFTSSFGQDRRYEALTVQEAENLFTRVATVYLEPFDDKSLKRDNALQNVSIMQRFINGETLDQIREDEGLSVLRPSIARTTMTETLSERSKITDGQLLGWIIEEWVESEPESVPNVFRKEIEDIESEQYITVTEARPDKVITENEVTIESEAHIHPQALAFLNQIFGEDPRFRNLSITDTLRLTNKLMGLYLENFRNEDTQRARALQSAEIVYAYIAGSDIDDISKTRGTESRNTIFGLNTIANGLRKRHEATDNHTLNYLIEDWADTDPRTLPAAFGGSIYAPSPTFISTKVSETIVEKLSEIPDDTADQDNTKAVPTELTATILPTKPSNVMIKAKEQPKNSVSGQAASTETGHAADLTQRSTHQGRSEGLRKQSSSREIFNPLSDSVLWAIANPHLVDLRGRNCENVKPGGDGMFGNAEEQHSFVARYCASCAVRNLCLGLGIGTKATNGVFAITDRERRSVVRTNEKLYTRAAQIFHDRTLGEAAKISAPQQEQ